MEPVRTVGSSAAWLIAPVSSRMPPVIARRWGVLLLAGRAIAVTIALGLLVLEGLTEREVVLGVAGCGYAAVSTVVALRHRGVRRLPAFWAVDSGVALVLVLASGDWRSPFYLLWLTALAVPAVRVSLRRAGILAGVAAAAFLVVAFAGGPEPFNLDATSSETFAIHLALPALTIYGLAYAADVLRLLDRERTRSSQLALEAERRRIAWELHDSAKQRVHAAHLLLTSFGGSVHRDPRLEQAIVELESAGAEMDTTLAGLRSPLEGRPLHEALAQRAAELTVAGGPRVQVSGTAAPLPEPLATHAYRIGVEALTNAVRHASATRVHARIGGHAGALVLEVCDDGGGFEPRPGRAGTGLQSMHSRAASLGGRLQVGAGPGGRGTRVQLEIPLSEGARP
jgi:signal transduction histidine kinase